MGLFGKNKLTIVKIWVKLWLKPTVDVEKLELVIGDDGELEAMTPDEAEKAERKSGHDDRNQTLL